VRRFEGVVPAVRGSIREAAVARWIRQRTQGLLFDWLEVLALWEK
jgi:hypothetical protein